MKLPRIPRVSDRKLFGLLIVGAYVLSMGTLAYVPIPKENSEYFGQLMMGLVSSVGIIVGAIWKNNSEPPKEK